MFSEAWKIFRGAWVASTAMVTVGGVAPNAETATTAMQTAPKVFASFILVRPPCITTRMLLMLGRSETIAV